MNYKYPGLLLLWLLTCNCIAGTNTLIGQKDSANTGNLSPEAVRNVNFFGQVWGLLKYHHPIFTSGNGDADEEFFKVLPLVATLKDTKALSRILEKWVDSLNDQSSPELRDQANGLEKESIAFLPDYGSLFKKGTISKALQSKLQNVIQISQLEKQHYIEKTPSVGNPIFTNEKLYKEAAYPSTPLRLLSLFRYWSAIQYFYPYRHTMKIHWTEILPKFITRFIAARDEVEYLKVCFSLISVLEDSHADIEGPGVTTLRGRLILPFRARWIENRLVVTALYTDVLNPSGEIKVGDIVVGIDGERVENLIKKYQGITSGSNRSVRIKDLINSYLLRTNNERICVEIESAGQVRSLWVENIDRKKLKRDNIFPGRDSVRFKLSGEVLYINGRLYQEKDFENIGKFFPIAKGLVIDMRGYPDPRNNMINTLVAAVKDSDDPFYKSWTVSPEKPGTFIYDKLKDRAGNNTYKGEVFIIVNEETQSYPEFVTMAFQSSSRVKVLGSSTAGADGNISFLNLPGGLITSFSGVGIKYPDGTPSQRSGVKIDYLVKPTIEGIKSGRDELLERAINSILEK